MATAQLPGITAVTRDLLTYGPSRPEKPLFFCQIEALGDRIFPPEVAGHRQPGSKNKLREDSQARTRAIPDRVQMATDRASRSSWMLIAGRRSTFATPRTSGLRHSSCHSWHHQSATGSRFLRPTLAGNYYLERDLLTPAQLTPCRPGEDRDRQLPRLIRRETSGASLTKKVLAAPTATRTAQETPTRWFAGSAAHSGEEEHRRPQRRGPPLLPVPPQSEEGEAQRRRAERGPAATRRPPGLLNGLRAVGRASHPGDLRPERHPVFPARFGLQGRHALPGS